MVKNSHNKNKKKDKFEPLPLHIDLPIPDTLPELKPREEDKEQRGVIIIELF